jgi:hypothetical protein
MGTVFVAAIALKSLPHLPVTQPNPGSHWVLRSHAPPLFTVASEHPDQHPKHKAIPSQPAARIALG